MRRSRVRFLVAAPGSRTRGRWAFRAVSGGLRTGVGARFPRVFAALTRGARKRTISRLLCWIPGGVPEWPKGPDCKSDGSAFVGSNPTPSTTCGIGGPGGRPQGVRGCSRGYSSVVEPQPSKLMARVQFPLPAPRDLGQDIGGQDIGTAWGQPGETPGEESGRPGRPAGKKHTNAHIAQSAERVLGKDEVIGSNPIVSTSVPT